MEDEKVSLETISKQIENLHFRIGVVSVLTLGLVAYIAFRKQ